MTRQQAMTD